MLFAGRDSNISNFSDFIEYLTSLRPVWTPSQVHSASLKPSFNGLGFMPWAHEVGQGQIGFSDEAPMTTIGVADCVGLILRDPASRKTALAHIDRYTSRASIDDIFSNMPDRLLQAVIIGAKYGPGAPDDKAFEKESSAGNLQKIFSVLKNRNVNIVAAQIYDTAQPSDFCVDPLTFDIVEECRVIGDPDRGLKNAKWILMPPETDLEDCFDFTVYDGRYPLFLKPDLIDYLHSLRGRKESLIAQAFTEGGGDKDHAPVHAGWCLSAIDALVNASIEIRFSGYKRPENSGLFVGRNALPANESLLHDLETRQASPGSCAKSFDIS